MVKDWCDQQLCTVTELLVALSAYDRDALVFAEHDGGCGLNGNWSR